MSKLLRANFTRLWKSKIFWIGMAFMFGLSLYISILSKPIDCIDENLFMGGTYIPVVAGAFIGLFIGTEYKDGTIRNKLIVGQTRYAVYFSNFIVCISALLMMHFTYIIVVFGIGLPLVGNLQQTLETIITLILISIVTLIALCGIFMFISMMIHSKSNGSVSAIMFSIFLLVSALIIYSGLQEPEYYDSYTLSYMDESGQNHEEFNEKMKNPNYLEGRKRKIYEFLYDFLPGCQMFQIASQDLPHPERLPLYSLGIFVVTTTCGIIFFRKKDLK